MGTQEKRFGKDRANFGLGYTKIEMFTLHTQSHQYSWNVFVFLNFQLYLKIKYLILPLYN